MTLDIEGFIDTYYFLGGMIALAIGIFGYYFKKSLYDKDNE